MPSLVFFMFLGILLGVLIAYGTLFLLKKTRLLIEGTDTIVNGIPYTCDGTYTVEEESAPEGYIKSSEKISFTTLF